MFLNYFKKQTGQVLLAVVLVMVVSLTLGLSIASKSITSFKTSTEEADSQKALHAAEAGIEQVIKSQTAIPTGSFENTTYSTTISDTNLSSMLLNGGNQVAKDEGIDLWLSNYPDYSQPQNPITSFKVYWGTSGNSCDSSSAPTPAIEIAVVSGVDKNNPVLTKYAYDPCDSTGRRGTNMFWVPTNSVENVSGVSFRHNVSIAVSNGLIARIIPLYGSGIIAVSSATSFPSQGKVITSTGVAGSSQRKVTVFQGHPAIPGEFFPYNIFSPKNE
ncbi:MAG: hypothetical protein A2W22_06835 [Candidatus Levybacteria bacterium RBG_16_35_11]|nr:MAG: hypothetical protein A2W22_06835 [Candidatus Levybacteria bacterium RBG_16_35_11]